MQIACSATKVVILAFAICFTTASWAGMPPQHYAERAEESKIKAIAVVEKVEVLEKIKRYTTKQVTFRLEYGLTFDTPATFTGQCASVDHEWQDPGVGGIIFLYPNVGERVFVTVSSDGGSITSFTPITPELENSVKETPGNICYGFSEGRVGEDCTNRSQQ